MCNGPKESRALLCIRLVDFFFFVFFFFAKMTIGVLLFQVVGELWIRKFGLLVVVGSGVNLWVASGMTKDLMFSSWRRHREKRKSERVADKSSLLDFGFFFFFLGKLQITHLKFGSDWILHPEILEFGFYPLKFCDV